MSRNLSNLDTCRAQPIHQHMQVINGSSLTPVVGVMQSRVLAVVVLLHNSDSTAVTDELHQVLLQGSSGDSTSQSACESRQSA